MKLLPMLIICRFLPRLLAAAIALGAAFTVAAQTHDHAAMQAQGALADARQLVTLPDPMRLHLISNMRDHLAALEEITALFGNGTYERAARVAEERLGMTSLQTHGAYELAPNMPKGMQEIGTAMHRAASRFAVDAQNAGATGDARPALAALSGVMRQCVACHAAYRVH